MQITRTTSEGEVEVVEIRRGRILRGNDTVTAAVLRELAADGAPVAGIIGGEVPLDLERDELVAAAAKRYLPGLVEVEGLTLRAPRDALV